jgi:hypothetical protein
LLEKQTELISLDNGKTCGENFGRLFDLAETRSSIVAEMYALGWEDGGGAWACRRQLWVWEEEMLGECQTLLHDISLQVQVPNMWQWQFDPIRGYSVNGAYQLLTSQQRLLLWMQLKILFGTNRSPWRYLFSPGDYWETDFQQK